jgi:hypothetical protein
MSLNDFALVSQDKELLDELALQPLTDAGLINCCRLIMRYEHTPLGELAQRAAGQLKAWGLERREAFRQARKLWLSGYRPSQGQQEQQVGSGADAAVLV